MHVSCHTHSTWTSHSPSLILIISVGRYNLWSYTLCSFLQFPITFSHKSLRNEQSCSETQCTVFLHHKPSVTPTAIKILHIHTHVYNSITSIQKVERTAKSYEAAMCISPIYFLSIFSSSNLQTLMPFQNTSSFPPFQNYKQCIS